MQEPALRIVVIGSSCAGKTTFAETLCRATGGTHVELDELFWGKNWVPKPESEFLRLVHEAASRETWVVSGNYGAARPILWARATTIVWLNYSFPRVLWRGLKRTLSRCSTGQELFAGNRESFRRAFLSKDSLLLWIVTTFQRRRREFSALRQAPEYAHVAWFEARRPRDERAILTRLECGQERTTKVLQ